MGLFKQLPFQNVLNALTDMVFIVKVEENSQFSYVFANDAVYEKIGIFPEQLIGKTLATFYSDQPERGSFLLGKFQQVLADPKCIRFCDQYKDLNKETIYTTSQIDPLIDEKGAFTHLVMVIRDITEVLQQQEEIKRKNDQLQEIEHHYRSIIDHNNDAMWFTSKDGKIQHANQLFFELFGIPTNWKKQNFHLSDILTQRPKEVKRIKQYFGIVLKGKPQEFETYFYSINGYRVFVRLKVVPVVISGQVQGFYVIAKDIAEQRRLEKELRQSKKRFEIIEENANDIIQIINADKKEVVYVSPTFEKALGFAPEETKNKDIFSRIHSEDVERVKQMIQRLSASHKVQIGEYRCLHKKGHWVWMESIVTPVFDNRGRLHQFIVESRDISERKFESEKFKHLAFHDALTGIPNRRLFLELLEKTLKESRDNGQTGGILYLDMDRFKRVNDTLGHDVGDKILIEFTRRVKSCLRTGDTFARMGGDEFTILFPNVDKINVEWIAHRILEVIQKPIQINDHTIDITSSIGISLFPEHGEQAAQLIKVADTAMYLAKKNGKNQFYLGERKK